MNTTTAPAPCDGRTRTNRPCARRASVTIPASAFVGELHFCRTHAARFLDEAGAFHRAHR